MRRIQIERADKKTIRRFGARPVLILAVTVALACSALAQPVPLFYRTDYSIGGGLGIAVALGNGDGTFQPIMNFVPTGGGVSGAWVLSSIR